MRHWWLIGLWCVAFYANAEWVFAYPEQPPYQFTYQQQAKGSALELVREALDNIGQPYRIEAMPMARALLLLKRERIDGIIGVAHLPENEYFLQYSALPIYQQTLSFIGLADHPLPDIGQDSEQPWRDVASLKLAKLAGQELGGHFEHFVTDELMQPLQTTTSRMDLLVMLSNGSCDLIVDDMASYQFAMQTWSYQSAAQLTLKTVGPPIGVLPIHLAMTDGLRQRNFLKAFDALWQQWQSSGYYQQQVERWYQLWSHHASLRPKAKVH